MKLIPAAALVDSAAEVDVEPEELLSDMLDVELVFVEDTALVVDTALEVVEEIAVVEATVDGELPVALADVVGDVMAELSPSVPAHAGTTSAPSVVKATNEAKFRIVEFLS